jgi:hypothetical protein
MKKRYFLLYLLTIFLGNSAFAQKDCDKFMMKYCDAYGYDFKYSGQSKTTVFEPGKKSDFKLAVFKNFEYRVSICADKNLEGIYFRIREDNPSKSILYDSSTEEVDYLEKIFGVTKARNLIIEVIVPESDVPLEELSYNKRFGCVGVLIEYNRAPKTGFSE